MAKRLENTEELEMIEEQDTFNHDNIDELIDGGVVENVYNAND